MRGGGLSVRGVRPWGGGAMGVQRCVNKGRRLGTPAPTSVGPRRTHRLVPSSRPWDSPAPG